MQSRLFIVYFSADKLSGQVEPPVQNTAMVTTTGLFLSVRGAGILPL